MNAQELLDSTARDEFLPRELWDIVAIPEEPTPEPVAPAPRARAPPLEIVDLPERSAEPHVQDVTPHLRRLARRLLNVGFAASAVAVIAAVAGLITGSDVFLIIWGIGFGVAMTAAVAAAHIDLNLTNN